jgi:hypothetical protein
MVPKAETKHALVLLLLIPDRTIVCIIISRLVDTTNKEYRCRLEEQNNNEDADRRAIEKL